MKKIMTIITLMLVATMVFAACSKAVEDETMPAAKGETMDTSEESNQSDDMDKTDDMEGSSMMNEGEAAPMFTLMSVDGSTVSLEELKGEKVYVKFWASWCSICLAGLDEIDQLAGMSEDYKVITIVTPGYKGEKTSEEFKMWFEGQGTENLIVLLDEDGSVAKEFGVRAYPTSAYIGSDGVLIKTLPGHVASEQINESFDAIY